MLLSIIVLQAVAGPPRPESDRAPDGARPECLTGPAPVSDIVVCAREPRENYRITMPDMIAEEKDGMPKADFRLFGQTRAKITGEQKGIAPGAISNRAMVKITLPF